MADKIKLGFIGSGGIVKSHLEHGLRDFADVEFVGWCDLNESTAAARRQEVGGRGKVYTDARKMLDDARPDAVFIMLPPFAHGKAEDWVIERRLPFFIEKPVAIDLKTARRVAAKRAAYLREYAAKVFRLGTWRKLFAGEVRFDIIRRVLARAGVHEKKESEPQEVSEDATFLAPCGRALLIYGTADPIADDHDPADHPRGGEGALWGRAKERRASGTINAGSRQNGARARRMER